MTNNEVHRHALIGCYGEHQKPARRSNSILRPTPQTSDTLYLAVMANNASQQDAFIGLANTAGQRNALIGCYGQHQTLAPRRTSTLAVARFVGKLVWPTPTAIATLYLTVMANPSGHRRCLIGSYGQNRRPLALSYWLLLRTPKASDTL